MEQKFTHTFDIDALGVQLGGECRELPGPGGRTMRMVVWTPELTEKLCRHIERTLGGDHSGELCHNGSAPLWVMAAALRAMYPSSVTFTPPVAGVELKLHNLSQGPLEPAAEVEFDVRRDGKNVYIAYKADDPNKPQLFGGGHHSYDPALIPLIKTPQVAEDEHVFLSGNSSYNVTMSIANSYFTGCQSLSLMGGGPGGDADRYYCAVSNCETKRVGDASTKPV